jgi:hypothetical protein
VRSTLILSLKYYALPIEGITGNDYDLSCSRYEEIVYEEVVYEEPELIKKKISGRKAYSTQ